MSCCCLLRHMCKRTVLRCQRRGSRYLLCRQEVLPAQLPSGSCPGTCRGLASPPGRLQRLDPSLHCTAAQPLQEVGVLQPNLMQEGLHHDNGSYELLHVADEKLHPIRALTAPDPSSILQGMMTPCHHFMLVDCWCCSCRNNCICQQCKPSLGHSAAMGQAAADLDFILFRMGAPAEIN